ncbi:MAG: hypothetical protein MZW92_22255, partial [Comamonadaceae bacterium]|nr:hypothetical protein [Comamonadaceae bacterium]
MTSAPLNPAYRADEFEFYLSDLNAKALIVEQRQHLAGDRRWPPSSACACSTSVADAGAARPACFTLEPRDARPRGAGRARRLRRSPTTSRWCCTPRAPPRGRRSCRCR